VLRRKKLPPELVPRHVGFLGVLGLVEMAKEALVAAVPSGRGRGTPLVEALLSFDQALRRARAAMPSWRCEEVEREWRACDEGLIEVARAAEALRLEAPSLGFESLLTRIGGLIDPLGVFEEAADRFRSLRR
jgi:hypothetical protein